MPFTIARRPSNCSLDHAITSVREHCLEFQMSEIELGLLIGQGSTANVYRARCRGIECAAKILKNKGEENSQEYKDMVVELFMLSRVGKHPNLVQFYGACVSDMRCPILVLELMEGQDLENFLAQKSPGFNLGKPTVYNWSLDILSALDFLHNQNPIIMHRDVKPANMLLSPCKTVLKLSDFGLAKAMARDERMLAAHKGNTGTPRYMAPEILTGGETALYTEKADIYSASLVIWYLLTGKRPEIDVRQDPRGRPLTVIARWRWRKVSNLLELMWSHQVRRHPSRRHHHQRCYLLRAAPHAPHAPYVLRVAGGSGWFESSSFPCILHYNGAGAGHELGFYANEYEA